MVSRNFVVFLLAVITGAEGYRILGISPVPGRSHFIMMEQLFKGLARRGHQVDVISTFQQKEPYPNYKDIIKLPMDSSLGALVNNVSYQQLKFFSNTGSLAKMIGTFGNEICKNIGIPEFVELVKNPPRKEPYDVIVMQVFNAQCYMIPSYYWKIPVVGVTTTSLYPWQHDIIGNPENLAISPNNLYEVSSDFTSFWTRLTNAYYGLTSKFDYLHITHSQDEILRQHYGPNAPSVREFEKNVSLILMNSFFPINGIKPMTTGLIEVGGLHIQNEGPTLNDDLKNWLDESKDGFIYFTFGSMLRIETFPRETLEIIFGGFKKIRPMRVLVKIFKPQELSIELPNNVKTLPWIAQEKVLQHPNIKAFVTHSGLLGTLESIYYGVPMICIPLAADQGTNAANYAKLGIAVKLDINALTSKNWDRALSEILHNLTYRDNMHHVSQVFRDRPLSALDTAIFWVEYIVRNGKNSLRSPALDLNWWQLHLFDVYAVIFMGLFGVLYAVVIIARFFFKLMMQDSGSDGKSLAKKEK